MHCTQNAEDQRTMNGKIVDSKQNMQDCAAWNIQNTNHATSKCEENS